MFQLEAQDTNVSVSVSVAQRAMAAGHPLCRICLDFQWPLGISAKFAAGF